jgi:glutathione S-transferase
MPKLCGFRISNYHNKVRIALLEKGIEHEEDSSCRPSQSHDFLARTPVGKVPFLELDDGRRISESSAICEYLEEAYPQKPLLPKDPWQRAKVRELLLLLELHTELVARRLYGQVAGPELTLADCAAFCHLPLVALTTKIAYGRDFLEDLPQVKPYIAMLKQRPAFARVDEDRKAAQKK